MASLLHSLVSIESTRGLGHQESDRAHTLPAAPTSAPSKSEATVTQRPPSIELDTFRPQPILDIRSASLNPSLDKAHQPIHDARQDRDLEMSRPTTPRSATAERFAAAEVQATLWEPHMNRFRMAAVSLIFFGLGLYDSAAGALIPYMEKHHSIGYAVVSLIFVGNALGFIAGAPFIDSLRARLGHAGVLALSQAVMVCGLVPMVCSPATPFAVVVACFFLIGFAMTLMLAMGNTFVAILRSETTLLGILHGSYGIGGTVGPLVATAMVTAAGANAETGEHAEVWSRYYLVSLGLTVFNGFFAYWAFRGYEAEPSQSSGNNVAVIDGNTTASPKRGLASMAGTLGNRIVLLGALFIFAYQGAEVSISGWVISFLIVARGGDPASVGYVTSGFWAGITIGRLLLAGPGASRFGERRFVYAMATGAAVFEALVWAVPNVISNAVSVAVVGLLLGPIYPCGMAVFMRSMDRADRFGGLGVITAFGSSGGAVAPFTTGLLAQVAGTFVLHPIAIALIGVMLVCWWAIPKEEKRTE